MASKEDGVACPRNVWWGGCPSQTQSKRADLPFGVEVAGLAETPTSQKISKNAPADTFDDLVRRRGTRTVLGGQGEMLGVDVARRFQQQVSGAGGCQGE